MEKVIMKLLLLFLPFLFIAHGKSIDPSQASWHKKYVKQQNAPDPADMLSVSYTHLTLPTKNEV